MLLCKEEKLKQANEEAGPDHRPAVYCCLSCQIECLLCQFGLPDWAGGGENPFFLGGLCPCVPPYVSVWNRIQQHMSTWIEQSASHRHTPLYC